MLTYCDPRMPFYVSSGDGGLVDGSLASGDEREHLAGDVALQTADRLQLGMAFCNPLGDVGFRPRVRPQSPDGHDVERTVGCRSPPRLSRWRTVFPDEAGTGLTPHSAAKPASERRRSGLPPAVRSSCAAPFRPIEFRAKSSGASSSTMVPIMVSRSAISSCSSR